MKSKLFTLIAFLSVSFMSQAQSPCVDIGFEGLTNGTLVSTAWASSVNTTTAGACSASATNFATSNIKAIVVSTPTLDAILGTIPNSPFAGTKALQLFYGYSYGMAKVAKTFTITNTNFIYQYAYMGALQTGGHSYCDASALQFRFFDCNNNPLSTISKTISTINPDAAFWAGPPNGTSYTPNWVLHQVNLSSYIGSCVRVEVIASSCNFGGHYGYCYYDDQCSASFLEVNGDAIVASPSYTSCASTATLAPEGVFSSYLWQGPPSSGVNGSTLAAVVTSVSGSYTLSVISGTNLFSQSVQLTVNNLSSPVLSGNANICPTQSSTLQLAGTGITSYSWSSGSTGSVVVVSPAVTTDYTVSYNNIFNCPGTKSITVIRHANPMVVFTTPGDYVCEGNSVVMNVINPVGQTVLWSHGANTASAQVSPTVTTVYTASVTSQVGCSSSAPHTVYVWPKPQLSITGIDTVCAGNAVFLQASGANTFTWSNGFTNSTVTFTPNTTTTYTVTGTNANACINSKTVSVVVNPLPVIQNLNTPGSVCSGSTVLLWVTASNGVNYSWSNGAVTQSINVSPVANTVYNVTVTSAFGCKTTTSQLVSVLPAPVVQIGNSNDGICEGESIDLVSLGNNLVSYLWSNGSTNQTITVTPNQTSSYSVTATDTNGCSTVATITVSVNACLGISKQTQNANTLFIYPNPSAGTINITSKQVTKIQLFDQTGRLLNTIELNDSNNFSVKVTNLAKGIYFVRSESKNYKVIIE